MIDRHSSFACVSLWWPALFSALDVDVTMKTTLKRWLFFVLFVSSTWWWLWVLLFIFIWNETWTLIFRFDLFWFAKLMRYGMSRKFMRGAFDVCLCEMFRMTLNFKDVFLLADFSHTLLWMVVVYFAALILIESIRYTLCVCESDANFYWIYMYHSQGNKTQMPLLESYLLFAYVCVTSLHLQFNCICIKKFIWMANNLHRIFVIIC